ncbi:unnamed protein product [Symbiodinium sp. CCMP2456]|nr:unnamed protein product [Symbiodinium sp. CCMP2456]
MSSWTTAIEHAGKVLLLEKDNTKALYRKSLAAAQLDTEGRLEEARADLMRLAVLEPSNREARELLVKVKERLKDLKQQEKERLSAAMKGGLYQEQHKKHGKLQAAYEEEVKRRKEAGEDEISFEDFAKKAKEKEEELEKKQKEDAKKRKEEEQLEEEKRQLALENARRAADGKAELSLEDWRAEVAKKAQEARKRAEEVVKMDEAELDEEDKKLLKETKEKGYYHGRLGTVLSDAAPKPQLVTDPSSPTSGAVAGSEWNQVCQAVTAGLSTFNMGLKMWQLQNPKPEQQKCLPPLHLDIQSPPVGTKKIPAGFHPLQYLRGLPELKGYNLDDSRLTYVCPDLNSEIAITSENDWIPYLQKASDGSAPRLVLHCKWSLKKRAEQTMSDVSEKLRQWSKNLLLNKDSQDAFSGQGVVLEELGYDVDTFSEVVDNMELPEKIMKGLKLAAKAKRGSNKVLHDISFVNGLRTAYYLKIQVIPGEDGNIDALLAIYRFDAREAQEGAVTDMATEQLIKKYIELDATRIWKMEAKQFMSE